MLHMTKVLLAAQRNTAQTNTAFVHFPRMAYSRSVYKSTTEAVFHKNVSKITMSIVKEQYR